MNDLSQLKERWEAPTPPFFRKTGRLGLVLAAIGGAILASPVAMPPLLVSLAGYVLTAGTVLASISQVTRED
jgi:uncharacterized membrane protein